MRDRARSFALLVSTSFRADPVRSVAGFVLSTAAAAGNALFALWLKLIVDAVTRGDGSAIAVVASLLAATQVVTVLASAAGLTMRVALDEKVAARIDVRVMQISCALPTVEHHERPAHIDTMELLRHDRTAISQGVGSIIEGASLAIRLTMTIVLLGRVDPLLLALPLFGVPSVAASARATSIAQRAFERNAPRRRLERTLFDLATGPPPGRELRLFGLRDEIAARHERAWRDAEREEDRAAAIGAVLTALGWLCFGAGFAGAVVLTAVRAAAGDVSPGDVVLAVTLCGQLNTHVQQVVGTVAWLGRTLRAAGRFLWLVDREREARLAATGRLPAPERIAQGIDLDQVSFRYPGTGTDVLHDVTVHLPAGATVAIVGDNGAGKTTLVKLLCRMYEPTSGRITVDGIDLSAIDPDAWRARLSAGFQDFVRFEFLARETVGVGDLPRADDPAEVLRALDDASATDVIDVLADGLETQLGRSFEHGAELSGGQWQKLALGRAMMRDGPLLLVLDEPTASLDAQTEHALFERYAGAARRSGITVLVSHRFSTVRMAGLILVVDGGRLVESGTHDELIAVGGLYAELYELQARAYR